MANLNRVFLIANLTRDPEVRYTPKGTPVCELGLAVNRTWTDDNGQRQEEVTFLECVLWSRQAEIANQYLRKGSPVFIEGRLQTDTWDDKVTGQKRSRLRVVGEHLQLLGARPTTAVGQPPGLRGRLLPFRMDHRHAQHQPSIRTWILSRPSSARFVNRALLMGRIHGLPTLRYTPQAVPVVE